MNENINLAEILKDCPKGTKLYSTVFGEVELERVDIHSYYPIEIRTKNGVESFCLTKDGKFYLTYGGECTLFYSRTQRDWAKFNLKKPRFEPRTLKPFDKVLVRDSSAYSWRCAFYSHTKEKEDIFKYVTGSSAYEFCIPYNEETKHLVGTTENAPEYYRYWDD